MGSRNQARPVSYHECGAFCLSTHSNRDSVGFLRPLQTTLWLRGKGHECHCRLSYRGGVGTSFAHRCCRMSSANSRAKSKEQSPQHLALIILESPFKPILAEQLNWMGCANGSISTAKRVSGAILVTPPAYSLWLFWMYRNLGHS